MSAVNAKTADASEMSVFYSSIEEMKFNPGRRAWIKYRDLGVLDATKGFMRAEVMHIADADGSKPTGWHYHTADVQFLMVVQGWLKMEFPEGVLLIKEGESIVIPGGVVHQELCSSEPMRLLEVTVPGQMGTVNVDAPTWGRESADDYGEIDPPQYMQVKTFAPTVEDERKS